MLSSFSMYFFPVFYHSLPKGQTPPIYQQLPPPVIGYPLIFRILLPPPPPALQHLSVSVIVSDCITSICIKACHDHMMKAIRECLF